MSPRSALQSSLFDDQDFTITFELVPGRGSGGKRLDRILRFAEAAKKDGRIKSLSITDNPGGHPALSPTGLGIDIQSIGIEPLLHFSLKDKNRNLAESQLFECHRLGLNSILVLGGDYPRSGYHGQALPVFDLDSTQLLSLITRLRHPATPDNGAAGDQMTLPAMDFLAGCVVSPFKATEAEQVYQYWKLLAKAACGARFIISQLGFDMDKYRELKDFCDQSGLTLPLLGNIFIPTVAVAEIMARGQVPGVMFSPVLLERMRQEVISADRGKEARLIRGAKMICVLKGLGYAGVHIGGNNLDFAKTSFMLDYLEKNSSRWREFYNEVHFPVKQTWYLSSLTRVPEKHPGWNPLKSLNRLSHNLIFSPDGPLFSPAQRLSRAVDKQKQATGAYTLFEHFIKKMLFRCRMCGDCTLSESSFLCPQSGCPKKMVNGPCGGSINGFCEVYPDARKCFWVRVYEQEQPPTTITAESGPALLPPKDWSFAGSSSWLNYFCGRDHHKLDQVDTEKADK
ncbi:MAG: methylenetetrahydrofolate reductase C-terminal domain-containing protein [Thermodesulfobacteriota bacterium]